MAWSHLTTMRSIITCLALTTTALYAQENRYQGGLAGHIGMSIPTGEFEKSFGQNMFHLGATLSFPFNQSPIHGGLAFGYDIMGSENSTVPITTDNLPATDGDLDVRCKVFSYHTFLRLSPLKTKVRPYVDALVGFRQFSTITKVTAEGVEEPISKTHNANDLAFSKGWAAGLQIMLGDVGLLELRVERFDSGEADYVDPASITVSESGAVGYNTLRSNTDVTNVMLGLGIRF
jgi:hypothetical protein